MSVKKYQDNNYKISNISIKDNLLSWEMPYRYQGSTRYGQE